MPIVLLRTPAIIARCPNLAALTSCANGSRRCLGIPRQLVGPLKRQTELLQDVLERERRLQRNVLGHVFGPFDAVLDLLEQSGATVRQQAEALEQAAQALEQTARAHEGAGGAVRAQHQDDPPADRPRAQRGRAGEARGGEEEGGGAEEASRAAAPANVNGAG